MKVYQGPDVLGSTLKALLESSGALRIDSKSSEPWFSDSCCSNKTN